MKREAAGSLDVQIDRLTNAGDGVGRSVAGKTVFVPFAAPGDRLRVRVIEERPRFVRAEIEEILESGSGRTEPCCAEFGRCGGCTWQHLVYTQQLEAKREILIAALERIGKLRLPEVPEMIASPSSYGYRARARIRVVGGQPGYRRRGSHAFCAAEACPILTPALQERWAALRVEGPRAEGEWELASDGAPDGSVRAFPLDSNTAALEAVPLELRVGRDRIQVSPGGFYQANPSLFPALTEAVWGAVGEGEALLELYAGAGFFTLELARRFRAVRAVEQSPGAVADLRRNLAAAELSNVAVTEIRVEELLEKEPIAEEVVLLDPPRTGLGRGGVRALLEGAGAGRPARIAYLSCDPATLARDLAGLCAGGFALRSVTGFDLFPQTPHVEALAVLERGIG